MRNGSELFDFHETFNQVTSVGMTSTPKTEP